MSWKRGAYPEFTLEDAVAVLFLLREPAGRKAVSEALDLGEGSVRTLLKKLGRLNFIESTKRGHTLNANGRALLVRLGGHFSGARKVGVVEGYPAYALIIRDPPDGIKSIELRDEAIRFFARGAMILAVRGGEPVFPEDGRPLRETMPDLAAKLEAELEMEDGALVVVTWADTDANAMKSVYHVALVLKGEQLPDEVKSLLR